MARRIAAEAWKRRLRFLRFGFLAIVCIGLAGSLSLPLLTPSARLSWVEAALVPSLWYTAVVAAVCALIYQMYKRWVTR
jgi:hypothetical protein